MRVRATDRGFYGSVLRRPGDVFTLARRGDFSARWMAAVPDDTPEQHTTAQQTLREAHDRDSPLGATRRYSEPVDPDDDRAVDSDFDPFDPCR